MKNFKFTKLALVVPILGISLCQQAAANSLPEKIQLNYSNTEYKMKCVEGGIPYWIKFDGEQFIHSEDANFSWGVKYDRKSGATSDFIPQSLRSKVVWTDEERRLYHQNLLTTAFAKIFRGDTVSFARGADIDFVGVDEQVKGPNLTRLVSQSVKFTPKKVIYEGSRIFVDGKIAGKIDTVSELTKEGKLVYPEIANKKYKMSMLVDLQAKLHVNTGFFTSLDGSINVVPEGQEPTLIKTSFTCEIAGAAKIPKGFESLKPLLIQIGAVDASPNDLLFFPKLIPGTKPSKQNDSAIALVIGVDDYELAPNAKYAAKDAVEFRQYAEKNLGVPKQSIFVLDGTNATERDILLTIKKTIRRKIKQNQSDVYIFFAGHGLASDDGQKMYLLPYDGAPELLDDTAILRDRLFSDIASANPPFSNCLPRYLLFWNHPWHRHADSQSSHSHTCPRTVNPR